MSLKDRCSDQGDGGVAPLAAACLRGEIEVQLELRHGGRARATLRYELVGEGSRVLLVGGGISAGRHVVATREYPEPGWWQAQAASFDVGSHRLLAIDWIGADAEFDVPIDAADQAYAIAVLLDRLDIDRAGGFIGASYGGMVALQFAARHRARIGAILVISAAGAAHPFASACRSLQRRALSLGNELAGVALARAMAMLTYRTPAEFGKRFADTPRIDNGRVRVGADDYLDFHGQRHAGRMSATAYRRLSESIDLHRIEPADVAVPATFAAVDSDALVPAADIEAFARAIPGARLRAIRSRFGHDAFLKEEAEIAAIITEFLDSLENHA